MIREDVEVSVVVPVRNAALSVTGALGSVLRHADDWLEVVAVDDGSTDQTHAALAALGGRDARMRVVACEGDGIVDALNTGLSHARGRYIGRMDADDLALPGRFASQLRFLNDHAEVAVVGSLVKLSGEFGEGMQRYIEWQNSLRTPAEHARDLFIESPLCHPSTMMRAKVLRDAGGYRHGPFPEDYELWLRLHAAGHRFAKVPVPGVQWHQHPGQLTKHDSRLTKTAFRRIKLRYLADQLRNEPRPICIWGAGPVGKRSARILEAHGVQPSRFVDVDPAKIGRSARSLPVGDAETVDREHEYIVAAVGSRGARARIRERLLSLGWAETADFRCIA